jgi:hypothetical protein
MCLRICMFAFFLAFVFFFTDLASYHQYFRAFPGEVPSCLFSLGGCVRLVQSREQTSDEEPNSFFYLSVSCKFPTSLIC